MKAGFIGLGTMGASMAANLQKGVQKDGNTVLVYDVRRDAAASHIKNGAVWADSPAALAAECDIIFSSLPGPVEFDAVSYGETGLLAKVRRETAYFDLTTNSPTTVRKAHADYEKKGAYLFDAPVSGGPRGAASGKLAIWEAVRQGAIGRRGAFESMTDQFLPNKYEPPAFALRLAHKDVSLATALGRELNVPMRLANLALADLSEGLNRGWGNRDSRAIMILQTERAGVEIKVDPQRLTEALDTKAKNG